jgi:hypothetical protein
VHHSQAERNCLIDSNAAVGTATYIRYLFAIIFYEKIPLLVIFEAAASQQQQTFHFKIVVLCVHRESIFLFTEK